MCERRIAWNETKIWLYRSWSPFCVHVPVMFRFDLHTLVSALQGDNSLLEGSQSAQGSSQGGGGRGARPVHGVLRAK
jgi:hypothetical protein